MHLPIDMLYPTLTTPFDGQRDYIFQGLVEFSSILNYVILKNGWELRRQKAIFDKEARSFV